jgi:hypothetical protein
VVYPVYICVSFTIASSCLIHSGTLVHIDGSESYATNGVMLQCSKHANTEKPTYGSRCYADLAWLLNGTCVHVLRSHRLPYGDGFIPCVDWNTMIHILYTVTGQTLIDADESTPPIRAAKCYGTEGDKS